MKYFLNLMIILLISSVNLFGQFGQNKVNYKKFEWYYIQTKHFDLYFVEDGREIAEFAAYTLEDALSQLSEDLNYQINNRQPVIIYNTHNDFQENNTVDQYLPKGIGGFTEPFKNRIVMPFDGDYAQFKSTLHHELVHAVMNDLLYGGSVQNIISKNITLNLPQWYNEGMAEFLSVRMETQTDQFMRNAAISESIPDITRMSGYTSYRAGESLFFYIAEKYGDEKVGEILTKIKNNGNLEAGFKAALGLSLDELNENWHKYLKKQYWPEIAFREDPEEFAKRLTGKKDQPGSYNLQPVISPLGDKIVYLSNRDIFLDVYIMNSMDGKVIKQVTEIGRSMDYEEINPLASALTWSPDNITIAVTNKSNGYDVINIVNTEEETSEMLPVKMGRINDISWSPDGKKLAIIGNTNTQSDVFIYNIQSNELIKFTDDQFSEYNVSWFPDSERIVFTSDRGDYTTTKHLDADFNIYEHELGQVDIYMADLQLGLITRLTDWQLSYEQNPIVSPNSDYILFKSDRNGIDNIYKKRIVFNDQDTTSSLVNLPAVPITNTIASLGQISTSKDGMKLVFDSEYKTGNNIFILNNPYEIDLETNELVYTAYMETVVANYNNSLAKSSATLESIITDEGNILPELTAKNEQNSLIKDESLPDSLSQTNTFASEDSTSTDEFTFDSLDSPTVFAGQYEETEEAQKDTINSDYSNYIFGRNDIKPNKEEEIARKAELFKENLDEDGNYLVNRYKIDFSPDLVYANAGYGSLYGLMGTTVLSFSDMLGNHRLIGVTSMQIDLKNSDYGLAYYNLENRTNFGIQLFHTARFVYLSGGFYSELHRFRNISAIMSASYPFGRFSRTEFSLSVQNVTSENLDNYQEPSEKNTFIIPSASYVYDNSIWGYYSPIEGSRFRATLFGDPGITRASQSFYSLVWDYRKYLRFWYDNSFVFRVSGGYSGGANPQRFILGGTENWLNRTFKTGDIPLRNAADFAFLSPALPLRGYDYAEQIGTKYSLINLELRMPLIRYLVTGPLPLLLQNVLGAAFIDMGSAWNNNSELKLFGKNIEGKTVTEDLLIGTGVGARVAFFFLWKFDVAWTYDLAGFSKPRYYISMGLDF